MNKNNVIIDNLKRENADIKKTEEETTQLLIKMDKKVYELKNELKEKNRIINDLLDRDDNNEWEDYSLSEEENIILNVS